MLVHAEHTEAEQKHTHSFWRTPDVHTLAHTRTHSHLNIHAHTHSLLFFQLDFSYIYASLTPNDFPSDFTVCQNKIMRVLFELECAPAILIIWCEVVIKLSLSCLKTSRLSNKIKYYLKFLVLAHANSMQILAYC